MQSDRKPAYKPFDYGRPPVPMLPQSEPLRPIDDAQSAFLASLEGIINSTSLEAAGKLMAVLFSLSLPYLTDEDATRVRKLLESIPRLIQNPPTQIDNSGSQGGLLSVVYSRNSDERSDVPVGSPEHLKIMLDSDRANSRDRIYYHLLPELGTVIDGLVSAKKIPWELAAEIGKINVRMPGDP